MYFGLVSGGGLGKCVPPIVLRHLPLWLVTMMMWEWNQRSGEEEETILAEIENEIHWILISKRIFWDLAPIKESKESDISWLQRLARLLSLLCIWWNWQQTDEWVTYWCVSDGRTPHALSGPPWLPLARYLPPIHFPHPSASHGKIYDYKMRIPLASFLWLRPNALDLAEFPSAPVR